MKQKTKCRLRWHDWTPWVETGSGNIMRYNKEEQKPTPVGLFIVQDRKCTECNRKQIRTIRSYFST